MLLYMLGLVRCMVNLGKAASRGNCRQSVCEMALVDWQGQETWAGISEFSVEVFNVEGWLSHGDFALEVDVDFMVVEEHRLIPAWVRSEWFRLRTKDLALLRMSVLMWVMLVWGVKE